MRFRVVSFVVLCVLASGCDDSFIENNTPAKNLQDAAVSRDQYESKISDLSMDYSNCISTVFYTEARERMERGNLPIFENDHYVTLCGRKRDELEGYVIQGFHLVNGDKQGDAKIFAQSISQNVATYTLDRLWEYSRPQ